MANDERDDPMEKYDEMQQKLDDGDDAPREVFRKTSQIAVLLAYDLIDKLRWLEKDTLEQSDDQIRARMEHMNQLVGRLRTAYLDFSDVDF